MLKNILVACVIALTVAGCSDGQQGGGATAKKAAAKDVELISVNGRKLMKSALRERVGFMVKMNALMRPKMTEQETQRLTKMLNAGSRKVFIREVVLSDYLKSENIELSEAAIEKERSRLLSKLRMKKGKYGDLRKKVRPYETELDEYVRARACEVVARAHILEVNPTNLPPNWAAEQLERVKAYNERMALTNALVHARATNVWEQLKSGGDFKELARRYTEVSMEAKDGGEWGQLELRQLEPDDELVEWAKKLKVGEFSPPIHGDNGLMILRIDEMKGEDFMFSRIFFRLPMFVEVQSPESMEKRKRQMLREETFNRVYKGLVKKAKIVRPKKVLKSKKLKKADESINTSTNTNTNVNANKENGVK